MFLANKLNKGGSLGGYQISRSLRFNSADSAYLNRTPASAGNRQIWTWSAWVKRSELNTRQQLFNATTTAAEVIEFQSNNTLHIYYFSGSLVYEIITTQVFRDPSAWYHIVWAKDTTQATDTNRIKLYVNGVQITAFSTASFPALNSQYEINNSVSHQLGTFSSGSLGFGGYMTEVNFVNAQQLTPSSFGETNAQTGVWQPKAYSGSYGTNGFYLNFSDNSNTTAATLGKDYSGNGNNWTPNNFSVTAGAGNDSLVDSPTSYGTDTGVGGTVRGNYCTWNPVAAYGSSAANGNLDATVTGPGFGGNGFANGTIAVSSGKWYWEVTPISGIGYMIGISDVAGAYNNRSYNGVYGWGYYFSNGQKYTNGVGAAYGATWTTNDVIGIALDMDAGTITFYKNGTSQGVAFTGLNTGRSVTPMVSDGSGSNNQVFYANFGQRPFAYTAPSGFKALCTQNLPTPTIGATTATQANQFFTPITWTGTDTGTSRSFTGIGFQPDFVWTKTRSRAYNNQIYDAVRGAGSLKDLVSNNTGAQGSGSSDVYGYLSSFNSDGFTFTRGSSGSGTDPDGYAYYDELNATYVAWNWKANGSGSTNTAGSITSTVSANTTSGFSVVTYTGTGANATVGHGLGVAPKMMIVRARSMPANWMVWQTTLSGAQYLTLETTNAVGSETTVWNGTTPSSTVISIGTNGATNFSGTTYVAYCFAEVAGYSKFGSYTGNGSADGPFVYCGFRPKYVLMKCSSNAGAWPLYDGVRGPYNQDTAELFVNLSNAEQSYAGLDLLSNGFKLRSGDSDLNNSGYTYIFMAFAEVPTKFSLAR